MSPTVIDIEENVIFEKSLLLYLCSLPDMLCSILWNLYNYYKQFSDCVQAKITELRQPIEKELKVRIEAFVRQHAELIKGIVERLPLFELY